MIPRAFFGACSRILVLVLSTTLLFACSKKDPPEAEPTAPPSPEEIARANQLEFFAEAIHQHTAVLASDTFEGRAPATAGEERTVAYLKEQFMDMGLAPGNNGSFTQDVPIANITSLPKLAFKVEGEGFNRELQYRTEVMVTTPHQVPRVALENSEMVFAGYGIVAPEYNWNDYADIDVSGKTVVVLVNDPGFANPEGALFNGRAMTYYGRWTYKYEEAARQGAAAVMIVHETEAAGYPWSVVSGSWSGVQTSLAAENKNVTSSKIEGWIQLDQAKALFEAAGQDFDSLHSAAAQPGFKAVPLNLRASSELSNLVQSTVTRNVMALLRGSERPDEVLIYTAHWDHLGKNPVLEGDQIYNGGLDNATGVGAMLGLAKSFSELPNPPGRSILFLAVGAEESGLIGSKYYAENPVFALGKTVAVLNMDSMAINGPTKDVSVVGYDSNDLEGYLAEAAKKQDRYLAAEPTPEKGFYYRSDHFSLAKFGVPALYAKSGVEHLENGREWMEQRNAEYVAAHYHKPSDEYDPEWDLRGAAQDTQLYYDVAYALATSDAWPNWKEGNEFRATRDASRELVGIHSGTQPDSLPETPRAEIQAPEALN